MFRDLFGPQGMGRSGSLLHEELASSAYHVVTISNPANSFLKTATPSDPQYRHSIANKIS